MEKDALREMYEWLNACVGLYRGMYRDAINDPIMPEPFRDDIMLVYRSKLAIYEKCLEFLLERYNPNNEL